MPEILPEPQKRKPLVSIERQYETDVSTGHTEIRVFIKFYIEARDSGLLAALSDRMCRTLICVATYMDENGFCYPSQAELGRQLQVRRENVNLRVKELLAFRFNGRPVISVERVRVQTANGSRWGKNLYRIHPISGFAIFDREKPAAIEGVGSEPSVRKIAHRPVCENTNTGESHTNQSQRLNEKVFNALPNHDQKIPRREGRQKPTISDRALRATYGLTEAQIAHVHYLVEKQSDVLGSGVRNHAHYVERAAEAVAAGHADLLDVKLSDFKQAATTIAVASAPAYFQTMWMEALGERQADRHNGPNTDQGTFTRRSGFEPVGEILRDSGAHRDERPGDERSLG